MMNSLLQKAQQAILQKVDPKLVPAIQKVVNAGRQVMYSQQTRGMAMQALKNAQDPESIGSAVAKLVAILFHQSNRTIPPQILFPAGMLLLFEALQFLQDAGQIKVDNNMLAQCTQAFGSAFLQMLGVTPQKLQSMISQQQGGASPQAPQAPIAATASPPNPTGAPAGTGIIGSAMGG